MLSMRRSLQNGKRLDRAAYGENVCAAEPDEPRDRVPDQRDVVDEQDAQTILASRHAR